MGQTLGKFLKRVFHYDDYELMCNPLRKSQDYFILQFLFATAFIEFSGRVILSGFAVYLGASDRLMGFISLIPRFCGVFVIFSGLFLERFQRRKKLVISLTLVSKLFQCLIVLIPMLVVKSLQVRFVFAILIFTYTLQAFNTIAVDNWIVGVVPDNIRGRYFARRQTFSLILTIILPFATGIVLDTVQNQYTGFLVLFGMGAIMAVGEVLTFTCIKEPIIKSIGKESLRIADIFKIPVKNREFVYFTVFLSLVHIVLCLSNNFSQVYMIRYLKLSYTMINGLFMFYSALQILFYRIWGKIGDKIGHDYVLKVSIWFYICEYLLWSIASKETVYYLMPVAYVFSAFANAGLLIGTFNRRYKIIPEEGRTLYDGFFAAVTGLSIMASPFIGGVLKEGIASVPYLSENIQFAEFRLLYGVSVVGIVLLQSLNALRDSKRKRRECMDNSKIIV